MQNKMIIAVGIGISIIIGVIGFQVNETTWVKTSSDDYYDKMGRVAHVVYPENPQIMGPLQINKDKYIIGENIFYIIKDLQPMDKGSVQFFAPTGGLYHEVNFDGEKSEYKKGYFRPQLLKQKDICEKELLIGKWSIVFAGYEQFRLNFEVVNEILPGSEKHYVTCDAPTLLDPRVESQVPKVEKP